MPENSMEENIDTNKPISNKRNILKDKRLLIVTVVLLSIILLASSIVIYQQNKSVDNAGVCTGEILDTSVEILVPFEYSKTGALDEQVNKIIALEGYNKDPNCLYPVMENYVFKGYPSKYIETFEQFESIYGDGSMFASDRFQTNIEALRIRVELYKEQIKNLGSGSQTFGAPVNNKSEE